MSWREWFSRSAQTTAVPASAAAVPGLEAESAMQAGLAAARAGNQAEAAAGFERVLEFAPDFAAAHRELGCVRLELGDFEGAADALELALHFAPDDARSCFLSGLLAQRRDRAEVALQHYRRALALDPGLAAAHNNLGYLLLNEFDRIDDAMLHFRAALRSDPDFFDARINLGDAYLHAGGCEDAIAQFNAILQDDPRNDEARLNRAIARLALRRWTDDKDAAWDEYETRMRAGTHWIPRPYAFAQWDGAVARNKTLLIYGEQGIGDEIMFASCIPEARQRVGTCIVECAPKLAPLFARSFENCRVVGVRQGDPAAWLETAPRIDLQIAAGSMPRLFRRTPAAFPAHAGYLRADPQKIQAWRERLRALGPRPKIALSWRGGTRHTRAARRSVPVPELAQALRGVPAEFISLQYDATAADADAFAASGMRLHQWPQAIADYDETAALLCGVDLVLSVCTALIHLGGALGRPVWVLVPAHPEWRYGESGEDMPWYPSVRLLRQAVPGDWGALLARVRAELAAIHAG